MTFKIPSNPTNPSHSMIIQKCSEEKKKSSRKKRIKEERENSDKVVEERIGQMHNIKLLH